MQQQQIAFGLISGVSLGGLGGYLAVSGIADWSLFSVGLGLAGISVLYSLKPFALATEQQPAYVQVDSSRRD